MTKVEFDNLRSDRKEPCPACGLTSTRPTPGCSCPPNDPPYIGTKHINRNHHFCDEAREREYKRLRREIAIQVKAYCVGALTAAPTFMEPIL